MSEANENLSPAPDLSAVLSTLISNPDTLSRLSGILSKISSEASDDDSPPESDLASNVGTNQIAKDENKTIIDNSLPTQATSINPDSSVDFSKIASLFSSINLPQKSKNTKEIVLSLRRSTAFPIRKPES